jgi:phosphatidylcholine synthase
MTARQIAAHPGFSRRAAAWAVHAYTATGAVAAFLGTLCVFGGRYRDAFLLMVAATVVDATDGALARAADVKAFTPDFDGARLDDIVDYLTFVFLPMLVVYHSGLVTGPLGLLTVSIVLLSSGYGFSSADAKTDDHFFTGFPSYWNIVSIYLYAAQMSRGVNIAVLLVLSALVFVRLGYVYPTRTPVLRGPTIALGLVWTVMMIAIILRLPDVPPALLIGSLFFPVYYTVLSLFLHARRSR